MTFTLQKISNIPEVHSAGYDFASDVLEGLSQKPKRLPSRYFYDERGSRIFEQIMKLEEYYPTACEREIFENRREEILSRIGEEPFLLIDLGAGDGEKTRILLEHFYREGAEFTYMPVDINREILEEMLSNLHQSMPELRTQSVAAEYFDALKYIGNTTGVKKVILFLGGNIGNFTKEEAGAFLQKMSAVLNKGDMLLIGIDLKKDPRTILRAYDDSHGVTAGFNLNLLRRINEELGGSFDLSRWKHYASYEPVGGAVESYLVSQCRQEVYISAVDAVFYFEPYEPIHTEYAMKYSPEELEQLALKSGFIIEKNLACSRNYFVDSVWKVS